MPAPNLFNVGALFVLLRETLEVVIVLSVLFNFISKSIPNNVVLQKRLKKMVWIGGGLGLFLSIAFGIAFTLVYYLLRQNIFEQMEALWEGCFKVIAAVMLTWIGFSMLSVDKWYSKWERKIQAEVDKTVATEESGSLLEEAIAKNGDKDDVTLDGNSKVVKVVNRPWGLFFISFTVIIREGLESVIFMTGVGQGQPLSVIIPGIIGILLGLAIGFYFWKKSSKLNMKKFLIFSAAVLFILSAGLAAGAAHEFEEFSYTQRGLAEQQRLNETLPKPIVPPEFQGGSPKQRRGEYDTPLFRRQQPAPNSPPKRERKSDPACPRINATTPTSCNVRTYYIAAVEEEWDYAPSGYNHFTGVPFIRDPEGSGVWTLHSEQNERIGSVYKKAHYVEFTDATFSTPKAKPDWLGSLGPIIRAEVGDVLRIEFKNMGSFNFSMHPHGVFYNATSEGAFHEIRHIGAFVQPNETYSYVWSVPTRAGPGPNDGTSVIWAYHSHYNEIYDVYSGLIGPLIVYSPGTLNTTTDLPRDVSKEFVIYLSVTDETKTHYIEDNIATKLQITDGEKVKSLIEDEKFIESNLKHGINGRLYNNLDGFVLNKGESVKWHAMAMGTEVDLHTLHFHGMTALEGGHRTDVVELFPASFKTITMNGEDLVTNGSWVIHCHVGDHITAGMISSFYIANDDNDKAPSWTTKLADKEFVIGFSSFVDSTPVLWDASSCCSEETNPFFQVLNALIGWRAVATVAEVVTYFGYWIMVILVIWYIKRRQARQAKEEDEKAKIEEGVTASP